MSKIGLCVLMYVSGIVVLENGGVCAGSDPDSACEQQNEKGCYSTNESTQCPSQNEYRTGAYPSILCCCQCHDGECTRTDKYDHTCRPKEECKDLVPRADTSNTTSTIGDISKAVVTTAPALDRHTTTSHLPPYFKVTTTPSSDLETTFVTHTQWTTTRNNTKMRAENDVKGQLPDWSIVLIVLAIAAIVATVFRVVACYRKKLCCFKCRKSSNDVNGYRRGNIVWSEPWQPGQCNGEAITA